MYDITLIGSISGQPHFSTDRIAALLESERTPLRYGTDFVGRPATAVFRDSEALAKLRTELNWAPPVMERWVEKALEKERESGVYHPGKCWFLAHRAEDSRLLIGNICPLLTPLHQLLAAPPSDPGERDERLTWFEHLFRMYLALGRTQGVRLDEGLSNFGLDKAGTLYYLDDDRYRWDDFLSLAHVMGTWFRTYAWFDTGFSAALGGMLREAIEADSEGAYQVPLFAEQMRALFMPQADRREALAAFTSALTKAKPQPRQQSARPPSRYLALLADVHANLPALDAVLRYLRETGISEALVLGDLVGYGPHPRECVDRLAEAGFQTLKGNHDHAAVTGYTAKGFSQTAKWCIEWTLPLLSAVQKRWLEDLPMRLEGEGWLAVHGAPLDPVCFNGYVYAMTYEDNLAVLAERSLPICFHGHTHVPTVYALLNNGLTACVTEETQSLAGYRHALICPGSVGQPRNRQPGAQIALWDQAERSLHFVNLPYDITPTLRDMRDAGFPESLCQRLEAAF